MIGTFVNVGLIITGSLIGGLVKKVIKEEYSQCLFTAMGLASLGLGANAMVQNMPNSQYPVLFIASLALGSLIGTVLKLNDRINNISAKASGDARLGQGIITGALLFCIGTLSILGPVQSALYGDHTFLFTNATLDFVTSMVLASTYGIGIMATAAILFCWQGSIYGLTMLVGDFITEPMMTELSIVGGALILSSGLAILGIKDCKTLNILPALIVPVVWCLIVG